MSHYFVACIIEKRDDVCEGYVDGMLEPYGVEHCTEEEEVECGCIGDIAEKEATEQTNKDLGNIDPIRLKDYKYKQLLSTLYNNGVNVDNLWDSSPVRNIIDNWEKHFSKLFKEHPKVFAPDPECDTCNGSGIEIVMTNPYAEWDWYEIGGRWNGVIQNKNLGTPSGRLPLQVCYIKHNISKVSFMLKHKIKPYAVIIDPGEWHLIDQDTELLKDLLEDKMDWYCVGVDIHF